MLAAIHAHRTNPDLNITIAVKGLMGKCGCTRMVQGGYNGEGGTRFALFAGGGGSYEDYPEDDDYIPSEDFNDTAKIIIITDKNSVLSFSKIEKKAKSGFTLSSSETAIIPLIPIKNTIGIIIINDKQRLLFNTSLFFAAKTLCQFP